MVYLRDYFRKQQLGSREVDRKGKKARTGFIIDQVTEVGNWDSVLLGISGK